MHRITPHKGKIGQYVLERQMKGFFTVYPTSCYKDMYFFRITK